MHKRVTAAEANRNFSAILRDISAGDSVVVTVHGRPVAQILPFDSDSETRNAARIELLARLAVQPALGMPRFSRDDFYDDTASSDDAAVRG